MAFRYSIFVEISIVFNFHHFIEWAANLLIPRKKIVKFKKNSIKHSELVIPFYYYWFKCYWNVFNASTTFFNDIFGYFHVCADVNAWVWSVSCLNMLHCFPWFVVKIHHLFLYLFISRTMFDNSFSATHSYPRLILAYFHK